MPVLKQNEVFAGRYVLNHLLGEGGFSEVWKARDEMADEAVVAIKIYAPGKGLDEYGLRQFRNEFSVTHNLSHPHLLKVYHFDIADGSPYLIMPLCPFGSLTSVVREEGVFSERQAALVMCQIGSALEEVHRQNPPIIHQDIKPDNILLMHSECYMLADFGISSRIQHTLRKATSSSAQSLTVAYAPPERFDRHPTSDPSSDIFSFGVTLYEMCTNTIPWDGAGGQCLLKGAHIPALPKTFSPELNKILEACMSLDRSKRPTARELHLRGRHFLETGSWKMPKQRNKKVSQKKSLVPYLLAAAAVALIALGGVWFYKYEYPKHDFSQITFNTSDNTSEPTPAPVAVAEPAKSTQLEDKLTTMEAQLVKATQQLVLQDSINTALVQTKDAQLEETKQRLANQAAAQLEAQKSEGASQATATKPAADKKLGRLPQELQSSLNRISDPQQAKAVRSGWKQEALARFADGGALVLDESDGKEYRAGIFLTLLLSSPHQVVVKEVKTDANNKITELRLTKQPL